MPTGFGFGRPRRGPEMRPPRVPRPGGTDPVSCTCRQSETSFHGWDMGVEQLLSAIKAHITGLADRAAKMLKCVA